MGACASSSGGDRRASGAFGGSENDPRHNGVRDGGGGSRSSKRRLRHDGHDAKERIGTAAPPNDAGNKKPRTQASSARWSRKNLYEFGKTLGRGHFAEVRECTRKETSERFAVKIISKDNVNEDCLDAELEVLERVGTHPNVAAMHDAFEDANDVFLVTDLCEGGDLFSRIVREGHYSERRAANICHQLAEALSHIHSRGVIHRDLKPENILLANKDPDSPLKVTDFGLSKIIHYGQPQIVRTACGTWAYCAPEIVQHRPYDHRVDHWSLGVLMYILLSGCHPFDVYGNATEPQLMQNVVAGQFDFDDKVWSTISEEPKRIIRSLLNVDPNQRMSLKEVLRSPWVNGEASPQDERPEIVHRINNFYQTRQHLRNFVIGKLTAYRLKQTINRSRSVPSMSRRTVSGKWNIFEDANNPDLPAPIMDMPLLDFDDEKSGVGHTRGSLAALAGDAAGASSVLASFKEPTVPATTGTGAALSSSKVGQ